MWDEFQSPGARGARAPQVSDGGGVYLTIEVWMCFRKFLTSLYTLDKNYILNKS